MNELPLLFGPARNLLGILSTPTTADKDAVACLLLNVGVTHRIGPRRLNVKFARQLADHGVTCLRFDLSGIGDSQASPSRANFREQAILDMKSAMDAITASTGIKRFAVLGICSGATNGYWLALSDKRVVGLLMFDGFTFPTFKTRLVHDWQRLRTADWKTVITKGIGRIKRFSGGAAKSASVSIFNAASDLVHPSRAAFEQAMESLVGRGVSVYLIYSGSLLLHHNYRGQLKDAFGNANFMSHVRYEYMPDVDHIATPIAAQQKLGIALRDWVASIPAQ